MKGKQLPEAITPSVEAALGALGIDSADVALYWWADDTDDFRILAASPIGLLAYHHSEMPGRFNVYSTTLTGITAWLDVHPEIETDTQLDSITKEHATRIELKVPGLPEKGVRSRPRDDDHAEVVEFVADCLRHSMSAKTGENR